MPGPVSAAYRGAVVTCSFCGSTVASDSAPITWVSSVEHGEQRWFCDDCSRTHLRAMESKLDSEWW
jgi:transposase-like protein